jgi:hypothetical protein
MINLNYCATSLGSTIKYAANIIRNNISEPYMSLSFLRITPATAPIPDKINNPRPTVDSKLTLMAV